MMFGKLLSEQHGRTCGTLREISKNASEVRSVQPHSTVFISMSEKPALESAFYNQGCYGYLLAIAPC
jgi:hypothetical protein